MDATEYSMVGSRAPLGKKRPRSDYTVRANTVRILYYCVCKCRRTGVPVVGRVTSARRDLVQPPPQYALIAGPSLAPYSVLQPGGEPFRRLFGRPDPSTDAWKHFNRKSHRRAGHASMSRIRLCTKMGRKGGRRAAGGRQTIFLPSSFPSSTAGLLLCRTKRNAREVQKAPSGRLMCGCDRCQNSGCGSPGGQANLKTARSPPPPRPCSIADAHTPPRAQSHPSSGKARTGRCPHAADRPRRLVLRTYIRSTDASVLVQRQRERLSGSPTFPPPRPHRAHSRVPGAGGGLDCIPTLFFFPRDGSHRQHADPLRLCWSPEASHLFSFFFSFSSFRPSFFRPPISRSATAYLSKVQQGCCIWGNLWASAQSRYGYPHARSANAALGWSSGRAHSRLIWPRPPDRPHR